MICQKLITVVPGRVTNTAVLILSLLFPVTTALAQTTTTGTIEGIISDRNGSVVPAVKVTVTSPNLIRTQSAVSDDEGRYRVLNLPPGRYSVTVEAVAGFARFARADVDVGLSKTTSVLIQLEPEGSTATVTINTSGVGVDRTNNTSGSSVSTQQFSDFVTQRTVQSVYTIAPSVARSGLRDQSGRDRDPSVGGSSALENSYIFDGVNTTDPAWGSSGANLPFEFVQEVEIKTGAYGAEYGLSTGGIFNVLTKSGGNKLHGDVFAYFTTKGLVRATKNFPSTGAAPNGFSELDAGFDLGGAIRKDKLWFFLAFNPQRRENSYFTQTLRHSASNRVTTPFYAGKLTYALNQQNTLTFSTFGDFTKISGFRVGVVIVGGTALSGFGADPNSFLSEAELGGDNYTVRLNSTITPKWIGEFAFGAHSQRNNLIAPAALAGTEAVTDNFAIVRNGAVLQVTDTEVDFGGPTGFLAFVDGRGGSLERDFVRQGFAGGVTNQKRGRFEAQARLQNIFHRQTIKYGFEVNQNRLGVSSHLTGPKRDFGAGVVYDGFNAANNFGVCTVQNSTIVCPVAGLTNRVNALIGANQAPAGITAATTNTGLTAAELSTNPFLIRSTTSIFHRAVDTGGDFITTNVESFYIQDDFRFTKNLQFNFGARWDYQQIHSGASTYLRLNSFKDNLQPRLGLIWDFTGKGKGKLFLNYARFLEAPIPVSLNLAAGGGNAFVVNQFARVDRLNAPAGSMVIVDLGGCCASTPVDPDLKPQTVNETSAGVEYEMGRELVLGVRGVYRAQGTVIEDGSFDEGNTFFLFNPGESATERLACATEFGCFGRARRYYRALEFTATKRFATKYQFIASYVYSSLIGNYEGLYRNDTGQAQPNLTTLFDLQSLLANQYGRLPNDRPHQLKFDGSYRTRWKILFSGSFRAQSGIPFNELIPHPLAGDNEGFAVPRGTAINPLTGRSRTPTTYNLDLGAYYPMRLGENRQLRIQLDWFNVFDSQRAVRQDETVRIGSGIPGADFIQFPNPFFGQGTIFQYPSSLRLGIKFQF